MIPSTSTNKDVENTNNSDQNIIIEEKVTNALGESSVRKYSKGKFLGKGGFAKCYEFTDIDTKKVLAAKIVAKSS